MTVFNRISTLRKICGLSQSELGFLVDVSKNSISLFETHKMQPCLRVAFALMRVFDCSFEDIFYLAYDDEDF